MTKTIVPFERPVHWKNLRQDEAERIIRKRALDTANIVFTDHAYDRVDERDIVQSDVLRILREGYVDSAPQPEKRGGWQAVIKKRIRGGREAAIVTVFFRESDNLIIVTVMWVDVK